MRCQLEKKLEQAAERNIFFSDPRAVLTLVDGRLVFSVALDILGEPLVKLVMGIEQRRHNEVQQGPQLRGSNNMQSSTVLSCAQEHTHAPTHTHTHTHLSHRVLDGRPGEQQSVSTLELQEDFPPNTENAEGKGEWMVI